MTLANKVTLTRIILIPVFVIGLLIGAKILSVVIFILSMFTDVLDGLIARKLKQHTALGSFLDPMADKLLLIAAFLTFTYMKKLPMWAFVVVFSRELLIVLGWVIIYILTSSPAIEPRYFGKGTTFVQMLTIFGIMLNIPQPVFVPLFWTMIAVTAVSTVDYVFVGAKKLGQFG